MRSIFSIRFIAAILGVFGLLVALALVFDVPVPTPSLDPTELASGNEPDVEVGPTVVEGDQIITREIDFVDRVFAFVPTTFRVEDHLAASDGTLTITGERAMYVKQGTPGEDYCTDKVELGKCAVLADLLGEGVVWFALVPLERPDENGQVLVELPAIDELIDGKARLINGWTLPYDPILTRLCVDDNNPDTLDEFESYRQFKAELGDDFTSIFTVRSGVGPSRLSAVQCRASVRYTAASIENARYKFEY